MCMTLKDSYNYNTTLSRDILHTFLLQNSLYLKSGLKYYLDYTQKIKGKTLKIMKTLYRREMSVPIRKSISIHDTKNNEVGEESVILKHIHGPFSIFPSTRLASLC